MSPDVFLNLPQKPDRSLLVSHLYTDETKNLISSGVKLLILNCMESPFIATRFYLGLKRYSGQFKYSFVFSGMENHLSSKTQYRQMFFPCVYNPANYKPLPFGQKNPDHDFRQQAH